jgi:hypothetical protein
MSNACNLVYEYLSYLDDLFHVNKGIRYYIDLVNASELIYGLCF